MICSIGVSIVLQEIMRLQSGARDLWLMPLFDDALLRILMAAVFGFIILMLMLKPDDPYSSTTRRESED